MLVGEVTLRRAVCACSQCGRLCPLDASWDLPQGRYSRAVVRLVSRMGAEQPFARVSELLWEAAGLSVSAAEVRTLGERVGKDLLWAWNLADRLFPQTRQLLGFSHPAEPRSMSHDDACNPLQTAAHGCTILLGVAGGAGRWGMCGSGRGFCFAGTFCEGSSH